MMASVDSKSLDSLGIKVLVAEDNSQDSIIAEHFLQKLGCDVVIARNGAEAIENINAQEFDVIFLDVEMPIVDGEQTAKTIQTEIPLEKRPKIIFVTIIPEDELARRFKHISYSGYISKPYNILTIAAALHQAGFGSVLR